VRLPVEAFEPTRNQRRTLRLNADLQLRSVPAHLDPEHFDLYRRYIAGRHPGGGMDNPSTQQYLEFLTASWCETRFLEIRLKDRLLAVAVIDVMGDALSAVYTFYDPGFPKRSLGKFAVLQEIAAAQAERRQWLYLGYWIDGCRKMCYKTDYQPLEYFFNGRWSATPPPLQALTNTAQSSI
jgi:arginine-tRNA-protein transferase